MATRRTENWLRRLLSLFLPRLRFRFTNMATLSWHLDDFFFSDAHRQRDVSCVRIACVSLSCVTCRWSAPAGVNRAGVPSRPARSENQDCPSAHRRGITRDARRQPLRPRRAAVARPESLLGKCLARRAIPTFSRASITMRLRSAASSRDTSAQLYVFVNGQIVMRLNSER